MTFRTNPGSKSEQNPRYKGFLKEGVLGEIDVSLLTEVQNGVYKHPVLNFVVLYRDHGWPRWASFGTRDGATGFVRGLEVAGGEFEVLDEDEYENA